MLFRIKNAMFNTQCKGILSTPPIQSGEEGPLIISMTSHINLIMYLIAIKSFYSYLGRGEIVIINDGSLTPGDIDILNYHVRSSKIMHLDQFQADTPTYCAWKTLIAISQFVRDRYVIQLDSDTITYGSIPEVIESIDKGRNFELGSVIYTMEAVYERFKMSTGTHVQALAERNFNKLKDYKTRKYVSGTSGFIGYAKGSFSTKILEDVSREMSNILGHEKWSEWGSEQVANNMIIANTPSFKPLPWPKYASYLPEYNISYDSGIFLHFIGTHRFENGLYAKMAKDLIEKLRKAEAK